MNEKKDYNILLLKVLAHDLLAPLTAVKWQTELLRNAYKKKEKRERYIGGIESSTELGISLTKHAHVAAKVLSHSYELEETEAVNLGELIEKTIQELALQYERHALELTSTLSRSTKEQTLDESLVTLYIWSIGKFFLACTPPNVKVTAKGEIRDENTYVFQMHAANMPDNEACAAAFGESGDFGDYDQKYVFATLMKEVAPMINATIEATCEGEGLTVTTTFTQ